MKASRPDHETVLRPYHVRVTVYAFSRLSGFANRSSEHAPGSVAVERDGKQQKRCGNEKGAHQVNGRQKFPALEPQLRIASLVRSCTARSPRHIPRLTRHPALSRHFQTMNESAVILPSYFSNVPLPHSLDLGLDHRMRDSGPTHYHYLLIIIYF